MNNVIECKSMEELESVAGQVVCFNSHDEWLDSYWLIMASYTDLRGKSYYRMAVDIEMGEYPGYESEFDVPQCKSLLDLLSKGDHVITIRSPEEWADIKNAVVATYTSDQLTYHCAIKEGVEITVESERYDVLAHINVTK